MEITNVKVKVMHSDGNLKAYATVTFDEEFVVKDIKVIEGKNGLFIAMPSKPLKNFKPEDEVADDPEARKKTHKDIAHPIKQELRDRMQTSILAEYEAELKNEQ